MRRTVLLAMLAVTLGACGEEEVLVLTSMAITPGDTTIWQDETTRLSVGFFDQHGDGMAAPSEGVRWLSGGPGIFEVDSNGVVTPVGHGAAVVQASALSEEGVVVSADAGITVRQIHQLWITSYITQTNQNPTAPIPLVPGRKGLFRLHVSYGQNLDGYEPPVARVTLRTEDEVFLDTLLEQVTPEILTEIDQSSYDHSYNVNVNGDWVREGLKAEIVLDPDDDVREIAGYGEMIFRVRDPGVFKHMLVPVVAKPHPNRSVEDWVKRKVDNGSAGGKFVALLPVGGQLIEGHATLETDLDFRTGQSWLALLNQLDRMRFEENKPEYYWYGAIKPVGGILGIARGIGHKVSCGDSNDETYIHEVGHSMNLFHAPCQVRGDDPDFPDEDGLIQFWGWNHEDGGLVPPDKADIMSYCDDTWIHPYHFGRALEHRVSVDAGDAGGLQDVLVVTGTIVDGAIALDPAFIHSAHADVGGGGQYVIEGHGPDGARVFAHRFTPSRPTHIDGRVFTLAIPVDGLDLTSVTVSGPEGSVGLWEGATEPMAMMVDGNGEVRAFRRNWDGSNPNGWSVTVSTGLPVR